MTSRSIHIIVLSLIFLIFAFLRFYHLEERIGFAWDQEQFSTQVRDIVRDHKFTLLGPRVTDDKGFFLAPYFTYILIPFYLITNLHPRALVGFLIVVNTLFFFTSYFVIKKLRNVWYALAFLILWTLNPFLVEYDTTPWWPVFIPIGTIIIWYFVDRLNNKITLQNALTLGLALGFFTNMHFQFVFLGLFSLVAIIIRFKDQLQKSVQPLLAMGCGFLATFLPLFLFDIRHGFLNTKLFLGFFSQNIASSAPQKMQWHLVLSNALASLTMINAPFTGILLILALIGVCVFIIKNTRNHIPEWYGATAVLFLISLIAFSLYGKRPSEYYFMYLYPFIILLIVDAFLSQKKYILLAGLIFVFAFAHKNALIRSLDADPGGLFYKDLSVKKILPFTKKPYAISLDMNMGTDNGYRYLIEHYGMHMQGAPKDPLIQIRIPAKKGDIIVQQMGISIPNELK